MGMEEEILKDFLAESKENLELLDQQFVELEQDPHNMDLIKSIFRTVHTIKGTAGFFGFTTLEGIAHFAEDILSKLRDGVVTINEDIATMLLQAVDYIKAILASLEQTGKEPDDIEYLDFIVELRNFAEKIAKGASASSTKKEEKADTEDKEVKAEPLPQNNEEKVEVPKEAVKEDLSNKEEEPPKDKEPPKSEESKPSNSKAQANKKTGPPPTTPQLTETHVRVDVHLLDKLMNLAGELVLSRNRLTQIASQLSDTELLTASQRLSLAVTEIQEQIMKTRMQPVGNVFNKFPRIVRDLSRSAQKQVQLKIEGAETELDRSIIESIKDPLTHMVRNSIDHGIEPPDVRIQKGKPAAGTLIMRAYHEGGQVIIEIQDDGAGIDPEKIKKKAIEKGVITPEQAQNLGNRDALMLIFQPGFSTAEKVTNISGRGVGMDVVKTNIEKLGGTVELQSEVDQGTVVRIKIPLTLAIIPALVVRCGGQRYCIPQVNLVELVHLSPDEMEKDVQMIGNSEFYRLRGEILPLIRLNRILELPETVSDERPVTGLNIVVLNSGDRQFGLVVDGIHDSEEIVVKPLGKHLKHIPAFAGTTLMGDGRVALILDVVGLTSALSLRGEEPLKQAQLMEEQVKSGEERQFLLLFTVAPQEFFAIPLALVNRLDKIKVSEIEFVGGREVIQYRGHSIPVIRLENFLPISPLPEQEEYHLIIFHMNHQDVAFLVSQIEDSLDIVIDVDESTFKQEGILGSAIIKNKTTLFIDVYQIVQMFDPDFFDQGSEGVSGQDGAKVLLSEDSTFYRNLLSSYLISAGYNVITAEDGQRAWEIINSEPIDILVTDIEMPNMDGFELSRRVKNDPSLKHIPIIAVTSLSGEEDRKRGKDSGIDEYQVKLNRDMVLESIRNLLKTKEMAQAA
ncbi:Signal transduction histidine kinase CheA [Dissulfuribacter thermophilus]|uniref:histidine kinase n=1 Tax=Dissulfuribacter thermophilus TaxID=1156395 RepID=A0A1B9F9F1_9BACT|nr:chemotaxis protein CheW [Dissulfuribacter thermophilus]OCC16485.1 Signal transduction histidine kinase CheA [Dissulfuribacter thermophilus]